MKPQASIQASIATFVEEEAYALRKVVYQSEDRYKTEQLNAAALLRALRKGIEMSLEQGGEATEGRDKKTGGKFLNSGFAAGYDAGWTAKNTSIQDLIDLLPKG